MSHSNKTQYYELPQYVGSDIINPLVDTNGAYEKIDTALHNIATEAGEGTSAIATLQNKVGSGNFDTSAQNATDAVNEIVGELNAEGTGVKARLTSVEGDVNTLNSQMQTANGAISSLQVEVGSKADSSAVQTVADNITALAGRMTTAESDIDTVEGKVTTLETDVDELSTRIGNIKSKLNLNDSLFAHVTADGVKTIAQLLEELAIEFVSAASQVADGSHITVSRIQGVLADMFIERQIVVGKNAGWATRYFVGTFCSGTKINFYNMRFGPTANECHINQVVFDSNGATYTNHDNDILTQGTELKLYAYVYVNA